MVKIIKNVLPLVALALGGVLIYFKLSKTSKEKSNELDTTGSTINDQQSDLYAEQLYTALQDFGTDDSTVMLILNRLSPEDFRKVSNSFGVRPYLWFGSAPSWLGYPLSLSEWLKREVNNLQAKFLVEKAGYVW